LTANTVTLTDWQFALLFNGVVQTNNVALDEFWDGWPFREYTVLVFKPGSRAKWSMLSLQG